MSDNLEKPYILSFSLSELRTHLRHVRIPILQYGKVFGFHVLLNKRWLTGNRPGSTRRETGRKKAILLTVMSLPCDVLTVVTSQIINCAFKRLVTSGWVIRYLFA